MLKASVGYSTLVDSYECGIETVSNVIDNSIINLLYTSCKSDIKKTIEGVMTKTNAPIIGCTSSGGVIVPDGYITGDNFAAMMSITDNDLVVGLACHEAGRDARAIGRKVAIEAVQNAKTTRAPAYIYMVCSPKEEEDYLMGIQDVVGRVPVFGGGAADNTVSGEWKIICNNKIISDGVAVAFFYTDNEIITSFDGHYTETNNIGIITEVENNRKLVSIDGTSALKKYAQWTEISINDLKGEKLLFESITKPLGIKDPLGNLTVIRHPMFGDDNGTKTIDDDTIMLGNHVVENTAIIQLEATNDQLIEAAKIVMQDVKKKLYTSPGAYILFYDGARRMYINDRIEEVYKYIKNEAKDVPFIVPFTFGEYGYDEHSANICGGLMLSFTVIGKD